MGNLPLDFVLQCEQSAAGHYLHTLSAADITSGWWEGKTLPNRSQQAAQQALDAIRQRLPFRVRGIHPDNDSGLVNQLLYRYCRANKIRFSRSRPLKKNGNP